MDKMSKVQEHILKIFQQNRGNKFTSEDILRNLGVNYNIFPTSYAADFSPEFRKEHGIQHSGASVTRVYWLTETEVQVNNGLKEELRKIQKNQGIFAKFERELDEIKNQIKKNKELIFPESALRNIRETLIEENTEWWKHLNKDLTEIKEKMDGLRKGVFAALNSIQDTLKKWGFRNK